MENTLTQRIARYAAAAIATPLPAAVMDKAKHHVLDTIAAMVSGATLEPGRIARDYVAGLGGHRWSKGGCQTVHGLSRLRARIDLRCEHPIKWVRFGQNSRVRPALLPCPMRLSSGIHLHVAFLVAMRGH